MELAKSEGQLLGQVKGLTEQLSSREWEDHNHQLDTEHVSVENVQNLCNLTELFFYTKQIIPFKSCLQIFDYI